MVSRTLCLNIVTQITMRETCCPFSKQSYKATYGVLHSRNHGSLVYPLLVTLSSLGEWATWICPNSSMPRLWHCLTSVLQSTDF